MPRAASQSPSEHSSASPHAPSWFRSPSSGPRRPPGLPWSALAALSALPEPTQHPVLLRCWPCHTFLLGSGLAILFFFAASLAILFFFANGLAMSLLRHSGPTTFCSFCRFCQVKVNQTTDWSFCLCLQGVLPFVSSATFTSQHCCNCSSLFPTISTLDLGRDPHLAMT